MTGSNTGSFSAQEPPCNVTPRGDGLDIECKKLKPISVRAGLLLAGFHDQFIEGMYTPEGAANLDPDAMNFGWIRLNHVETGKRAVDKTREAVERVGEVIQSMREYGQANDMSLRMVPRYSPSDHAFHVVIAAKPRDTRTQCSAHLKLLRDALTQQQANAGKVTPLEAARGNWALEIVPCGDGQDLQRLDSAMATLQHGRGTRGVL